MRDDDRNLERFFDMDQESELIEIANLDLLNTSLHHQIMQTAIQLAEREWFWRWRSVEYKLRKVAMTFRQLNKLIADAKDE